MSVEKLTLELIMVSGAQKDISSHLWTLHFMWRYKVVYVSLWGHISSALPHVL